MRVLCTASTINLLTFPPTRRWVLWSQKPCLVYFSICFTRNCLSQSVGQFVGRKKEERKEWRKGGREEGRKGGREKGRKGKENIFPLSVILFITHIVTVLYEKYILLELVTLHFVYTNINLYLYFQKPIFLQTKFPL